MSLSYIREYYAVPAVVGRRVVAYGKPGIIMSAINAYIGVVLDDDPKRRPRPHHPTDGIVYGELAEKLPKPPRRSNYEEFQHDESGLYFHEWLRINKPHRERRVVDGRRQFRMYRTRSGYDSLYDRDVEGEWSLTAAEAKASYKEALKKYKAAQREAEEQFA
jgi:hypothetical protein